MAIAGHIVSIAIATGASMTYDTVGGLMTMKSARSRDLLDITDLLDENGRRRIVGLSDFSLSLDGRLEKDTGYLRLLSCHRNEQPAYVQVLYNGVSGFMAPFYIKTKTEEGKVDDAVRFKVELQCTGEFGVVDV